MSDPRYADAFLLLTRSQNSAVNSDGTMPVGSLYKIERSLRGSPDFRLAYENADATVFVLANRGAR